MTLNRSFVIQCDRIVTASNLDQARGAYLAGQAAFERGRYRESIQYFEQAVTLAQATSPLGGEIQTWLVNAYAAADRTAEAIALCEKLSHHPDLDTRKQGKRLLYILNAPKLKLRPEWKTEIPDLASISDNRGDDQPRSRYTASQPKPAPRSYFQPSPEPIDLNQVNTQDNQFLWFALAGLGLILGGLIWLS